MHDNESKSFKGEKKKYPGINGVHYYSSTINHFWGENMTFPFVIYYMQTK